MSPDLARRAEELFIELADLPLIELADLPPEQRGPRLEEACAGNEALRDEVLSLLEALEEETGFLENPRVAPPAAGLDATLPAGTRIGAYTILGVLGSGGMGVVYLARQERPRRTVALKLIRRGLASPSMLRRFEHEAEVLGRLQHPGIAQIYEAGVAESASGGQPFIAMEFVRGRSLIDYARAHNLGTRERLELFARICDGVQHAHQRGVIHRDLKPANILVVDPTAEDKAAAAPPLPPPPPLLNPRATRPRPACAPPTPATPNAASPRSSTSASPAPRTPNCATPRSTPPPDRSSAPSRTCLPSRSPATPATSTRARTCTRWA